jgi:hypothetical protein
MWLMLKLAIFIGSATDNVRQRQITFGPLFNRPHSGFLAEVGDCLVGKNLNFIAMSVGSPAPASSQRGA